MKRRELITGIAVILAMIAVGAGLFWRSYLGVKSGFGMWETAQDMPSAGEPWRVDMKFRGARRPCSEGLAWDETMFTVLVQDGGVLSFYGEPVLVDYCFWGKWYTVYEGDKYYTIYPEGAEKGGLLRLRFPQGLFSREGLYRVRLAVRKHGDGELAQVGSCQFREGYMARSAGPVDGADYNDFDRWDKCSGEDNINESLTLTPKRTYIDDEGVARLEFGLVCDSDYYYYGPDYMRVDMLWQGDWYTVSARDTFRAYAAGGECVPGQEYIHSAEIPRQVLRHPGTYRLYWGDVAYCEFTVK